MFQDNCNKTLAQSPLASQPISISGASLQVESPTCQSCRSGWCPCPFPGFRSARSWCHHGLACRSPCRSCKLPVPRTPEGKTKGAGVRNNVVIAERWAKMSCSSLGVQVGSLKCPQLWESFSTDQTLRFLSPWRNQQKQRKENKCETSSEPPA